jgi:hypothetical protein
VIVGGWVSLILTVKVLVALFPDGSVEIFVTVVVPTGKKEPDAGLAWTVTPGQLSVAVAE